MPSTSKKVCVLIILNILFTDSCSHLSKKSALLFTDGTLAVASSALTGRTWNGSLWLFKDRAKAPDVHYCSAGCSTESGTTDIKWIDSRRLVLGSDSGTVDIWCLSGSFQSLENMASLTDHDNTVSSVSVDCIKSKIVSASWDRRYGYKVKIFLTEGPNVLAI